MSGDDQISDGPPRGWCPECDGPSRCAPGTCCGVGAPEAARDLHEALDDLQGLARRLGFCCYAAALDPNGPCPWHAEASTPPPAAPAPITAEDVRAAERAWGEIPRRDRKLMNTGEDHGWAAFVADYLNRRGERA